MVALQALWRQRLSVGELDMVYCRRCCFYHNGRLAKQACSQANGCGKCADICQSAWPTPFMNSLGAIPRRPKREKDKEKKANRKWLKQKK